MNRWADSMNVDQLGIVESLTDFRGGQGMVHFLDFDQNLNKFKGEKGPLKVRIGDANVGGLSKAVRTLYENTYAVSTYNKSIDKYGKVPVGINQWIPIIRSSGEFASFEDGNGKSNVFMRLTEVQDRINKYFNIGLNKFQLGDLNSGSFCKKGAVFAYHTDQFNRRTCPGTKGHWSRVIVLVDPNSDLNKKYIETQYVWCRHGDFGSIELCERAKMCFMPTLGDAGLGEGAIGPAVPFACQYFVLMGVEWTDGNGQKILDMPFGLCEYLRKPKRNEYHMVIEGSFVDEIFGEVYIGDLYKFGHIMIDGKQEIYKLSDLVVRVGWGVRTSAPIPDRMYWNGNDDEKPARVMINLDKPKTTSSSSLSKRGKDAHRRGPVGGDSSSSHSVSRFNDVQGFVNPTHTSPAYTGTSLSLEQGGPTVSLNWARTLVRGSSFGSEKVAPQGVGVAFYPIGKVSIRTFMDEEFRNFKYGGMEIIYNGIGLRKYGGLGFSWIEFMSKRNRMIGQNEQTNDDRLHYAREIDDIFYQFIAE